MPRSVLKLGPGEGSGGGLLLQVVQGPGTWTLATRVLASTPLWWLVPGKAAWYCSNGKAVCGLLLTRHYFKGLIPHNVVCLRGFHLLGPFSFRVLPAILGGSSPLLLSHSHSISQTHRHRTFVIFLSPISLPLSSPVSGAVGTWALCGSVQYSISNVCKNEVRPVPSELCTYHPIL